MTKQGMTRVGGAAWAKAARGLVALSAVALVAAAAGCDKKDEKKDDKKEESKASSSATSTAGPKNRTMEEVLGEWKASGKKIAWEPTDFDNTKDSFKDSGAATCNALVNAAFACRDRVKATGNMPLWAGSSEAAASYRRNYERLAKDGADPKKLESMCVELRDKMKKADDCVAAVHQTKADLFAMK